MRSFLTRSILTLAILAFVASTLVNLSVLADMKVEPRHSQIGFLHIFGMTLLLPCILLAPVDPARRWSELARFVPLPMRRLRSILFVYFLIAFGLAAMSSSERRARPLPDGTFAIIHNGITTRTITADNYHRARCREALGFSA